MYDGGPSYCDTCRKAKGLGPEESCAGCNEPALTPGNAKAVNLFLAARSAWTHKPSGHSAGWNWERVQALMDLLGYGRRRRGITERLMIIEREILAIEAETRQRGNED